MKIGVNARLLQEKHHTGIQNYFNGLYSEIKSIDFENQYFFFRNPSIKNAFFDLLGVKNQIKKAQINIFHSLTPALPVGSKNCFYLATVHDLGFKIMPELARKKDILYYNFVFRNLIRKADLVLVDSESVKQELTAFYPILESRIRTVELGLDAFYLQKEQNQYLEQIRQKYFFTDKKIVFANSAHSPRKNTNALIKAVKDIPGCYLVISGLINNAVKIDKQSNVIALGYLPKREIRALYQLCDAFVYPSLYEGFGLPILEAMASKAIVLASDISVFKEIINNNSLLFDPGNPEQMAERISSHLNSSQEQKQNIIASYQESLNRFTWNKAARKMIDIFNSLK